MNTGSERVRAVGIDRLTDTAGIHQLRLPAPECGADQVVLAVEAVAVNHVDTFVRSGVYATELDFPVAVGRDAVGTIEAVGASVTGLQVGQRAWTNSLGFAGRPGATAERVAVDAEQAYLLPPDVDPVAAAAALHPCTTAALAVQRQGNLQPGESIYIAGGAGQVGSAAIVLAVARGARVLASASADDAGYCRGLGAQTVLDYRDPDLVPRLLQAVPDGIDVHIDTAGHNDLAAAVKLAAPRGRIVLLAGPTTEAVLPVGQLYMRDASLRGFAISNATVGELADAAETVNMLLATGAWTPRQVSLGSFDDAGWAHARLESGQNRGTRIVLRPAP
ncbi:NADPH:quinone reductase [Arthrobacter rhombi]|uniref:NADPH:quinone reductase n=1 Tax=Arthrobacter rhombi TaxID=71253 RepID=UPI003F910937